MKRYGAIILAILFVLGLAASAFAIHAEIPAESQAVIAKGQTQITIGGDLRFRGSFDKNLSDQKDGGTDDHVAYIDQRVRLKLDIKVTDNTSARIHIEHGNLWGEGWSNKDEAGNAKGSYPVGNHYEQDNFKFVEAWINHNFGSFGIKVGHMPLALGNKLFFDHTKEGDDAIVIYGSTSNIHWAGVVAKFNEGTKGINDDSTAYVILANYKGDGFNLGGDVTFVDDQSCAGLGCDAIHGWNFGLRGDTTFAGLQVKGDVEIQTGKFKKFFSNGDDWDVKAYAFLIGADYNLGNSKIGAEFVYGSGDDDPNDTDMETFITSLSQVQYGPYIYGYKSAATACNVATCTGQTGISNTWWIALKGSTKVSKDLSINGAIYYLQASEDVAINGTKKDSDLGVEIDGKVTYNLDRNLKYWVEGGYFFTGDAYQDGNADDMYSIRNGIQLSF